MFFSIPFYTSNDFYRPDGNPNSYKTLQEALVLVKDAIKGEKEDELFYSYLISVAPTEEEKSIISTIRDDEIKHNNYFNEIYRFYTKENLVSPQLANLQRPKSYIDGIIRAKFGELAAMERYRDIRAGIPDEYYRDMVFEILTDELKHAHKYDFILYLSLTTSPLSTFSRKIKFTSEDGIVAAKILGIDFSKEKFDLEQLTIGLNVELEHGKNCYQTNISNDDLLITAKIALVHLREFPDYYTRLKTLEDEAKAYWSTQ